MTSLKKQLLSANLGLTEDDFDNHCTDLYVLETGWVKDWLRANYKFYKNVTTFIGAEGSTWAGKRALAVPFAHVETTNAKVNYLSTKGTP